MKARGSEMPDGWVKPRPLQGWVQSVICNLKGLSALNVNSAFVGAIIIVQFACLSHTPQSAAQRKMSKLFPLASREIRVQRGWEPTQDSK